MNQSKIHNQNVSQSILSGKGVASIAKNAGYLLGGRWLTNAVRFIYAIALARYLGPELYGLFNYGLSWYMAFLPITGLGLEVILSREIGRNRDRGAKVVAQTLTLRIFATIVCAAVCGLTGWLSEGLPETRILLLTFSIALAGRALALWAQQLFTAYEENRYSFRLQAIFRPLEVVFGLFALIIGGRVMALASIHAVFWWLQALAALTLIRRHLVTIRLDLDLRSLMNTLAHGLPIGLGLIFVTWFWRGPLVLFRHTAGDANNLGQLALAIQVFTLFSSLPLVASTASLPVLSRAVARQDGKDRFFAEAMMRFALIFGTAVALAGFGAGAWMTNLIFGPKYIAAGHLLGPALSLFIPMACGNAISRVYFARGQFFLPTVCAGVGALVFTLSMPWLVNTLDTLGTLVATGVGMGIWALSLILALAKSDELDIRQAIYRPGVVVVLALVTFFVLKPLNAWLALAIGWIALLSGTLRFGVLTPEDRSALKKIREKLFSSPATVHDPPGKAKGKI